MADRDKLVGLAALGGLAALSLGGSGGGDGGGDPTDTESPTASINRSVDGAIVTATASGSTDNDQIETYRWWWGDGTTETTSDPTQQHQYFSPGEYTITLQVEDRAGNTDETQTTVTIVNEDPEAALTRTVDGMQVTATASGSTDDTEIVAYSFSWGDGTTDMQESATAQHTYESGGTYTIAVTVEDEFGVVDTAQTTVSIVEPNEPPTARISRSVDGMEVTATGSASTDPDNNITEYRWQWGDSGATTTTDPTAQHTYSSGGTFTITLTVVDEQGASDTAQTTVSITAPNTAPTARLTRSLDGATVTATASASSDPDDNIARYEWNWGDGSTETTQDPTRQHTYPANGNTYVIQVTVVDADGLQDMAETTVTVPNNSDPSGSVSISQGGDVNDDAIHVDASASDPEGDAVEVQFEAKKNGAVVATTDWDSVSFRSSWDWGYNSFGGVQDNDTIRVTATFRDSFGNTDVAVDSISIDFSDGGDGDTAEWDHTLSVSYNDRFVSGPCRVQVETTDTMFVDGFEEGTDYSNTSDGGRFDADISDSGAAIIEYDGEIQSLDWNAPIITFKDGTRVDPYEQTAGGPRYRYMDGTGSEVLEIVLRTSEERYTNSGFTAARNAAEWMSGAFRNADVNHDILYVVDPIGLPTENTQCDNPWDRDTGQWDTDSDIFQQIGTAPALYWYTDHVYDIGLQQSYNDTFGENVETTGDMFVQRKDSNMLLTYTGGGGCAYVGGDVGVSGGSSLFNFRTYDASPSGSGFVWDIQTILHETGHNLGYHHPDDTCNRSGGRGENGSNSNLLPDGVWYETPCMPQRRLYPCTNKCGTLIPDKIDEQVKIRPRFTDCTIDIFRANSGSEQGNSETAGLSTMETCGHCEEAQTTIGRQEQTVTSGTTSTGCDCSHACSCD